MTHKTLKEAYESVGLMPQVGDVIDGSPIIECCGVPNSCFITFTQESDSRRRWLRLTDKIASHYFIGGTVQLKITRAGKQIYPAVEDLDSECKIAFRNLREDLDSCNVPYPATLANSIFNLIDAKIKEAIK